MQKHQLQDVIIEMSQEEFAVMSAAMGNLLLDIKLGPMACISHPQASIKLQLLLPVSANQEHLNSLSMKLSKMIDGLMNLSNI